MLDLLQVANPIIGLGINVLIQILRSRYSSSSGLLKTVILGFAGGAFGVLALDCYILHNQSLLIKNNYAVSLTNLIIYSLLGYCYFHFINLGETARRIRIVTELFNSREGLTLEDILRRYDSREMVEKRIGRLVNNGQVVYRDGKYFIGKPVVLMMAKIIVMMKLIILSKRSEFD